MNNSLSERDQLVNWHPYTQMQTAPPPIGIVRGEGAVLFAEDGREYIDAVSSWWVNIHGHAHPHIAERVSQQLRTLEHVIFAGFTHAPAVELSERLLKLLPANQAKVFYTDNGSTAVEVALKMALQYWHNQGIPKSKIIALEGSYHGDTFGAMSISERSVFTRPFQQYLFDVEFLPVPVPGQEEAVLAKMEELLTRPDIAAFVFEPLVLGTAGMVMYEPEVLDKLMALCRQKGVIIIADEVMTGFGRTGKRFAADYLTQAPDLMCFSKGITGGTMALGVTTCTHQLYASFLSEDKTKALFHGHSYTANPIACAAALASLDLVEPEDFLQNLDRISAAHAAFALVLKNKPGIKEVRQRGTILAVELEVGATTYFHSLRDQLYQLALENGVLLRPLGNIVYVLPPYCITQAQLNQVYGVLEQMRELVTKAV
ncbi:adenosylmethionine--8-amino-7-oxononanoate transaminase [Rufibacter glacialis]|uniref:Adenosylmethionine-8-amino-7-oxononanoate aminotransferase n=1 Tax=Rufibacter glacialis TaxID=1259555 RepID=A0A5M8Q6W4_9BACT|nr:adenosylmethionine--8-amino-7-oxononanoate transaminase [Rufibacter glacialis]KAA6431675.1 adenosylmethionine--8-amino-7-oxononanoate transaminase [Rufibacter glacialis]GGK82523.1 adenosylmethionine--8-amino-7-oxononanoate aminotransferase BioA [Rufibacter glacialis]